MRVRKHLSYANVVATIALFGVVAGGGAYAASKIGTSDIKSKAVTQKKLDTDAVVSSKIVSGAVGTDDLDPAAGGILAGLTYSESSGIITSFNRTDGGEPTVDHVGTGTYAIYFPGLEHYDFTRAVQSGTLINRPLSAGELTIHYDNCSALCNPPHPVVTTRDSAGDTADPVFQLPAVRYLSAVERDTNRRKYSVVDRIDSAENHDLRETSHRVA